MKLSFIVNSILNSPPVFEKKLARNNDVISGHNVQILYTETKGHSLDLTRQAMDSRPDLILGFGGDGTLHEIVNGYLYSDKNHECIIGQVPVGSGNDFSRNFKLSKNLKHLGRQFTSPAYEDLDIGELALNDGSIKYFHNEVSFGFGAEVIRRIEEKFPGEGNHKSYFKSIISAFNAYRPTQVKVIGDNFKWEGKAFLVIAANGRYMGGGLCLAPQAVLNDGILSITIVGEVSLWEYLLHFARIIRGRPVLHPQVFYFESRELEIHSDDTSFAAEADGELMASVPKKISCLHKRIRFLK